MKIINILIDLKKLFQSPTSWTKISFARNISHNQVKPNDESASCWCILGGIERLSPDYPTRYSVCQYLSEIINKETRFTDISAFNDNIDTSHKDVLNIIDQAIIKCI